jgi:hypothetical protein
VELVPRSDADGGVEGIEGLRREEVHDREVGGHD